ncbi:MAG: MFS transporter, partial [SAR202 cluster bacterium]|nr:MFS transporter [SAR202 cluster bacterium]
MPVTDLLKNRGRGIFYGWWIVLAGFMIQMLNGGLFMHSFGAYFVYLQADFGWSRTVLSGAFSLQQMETGILGPLQGWLIVKFGPRTMVRIGVVVAGIGLMMFSQVNSIWMFYLAFVTIALGSSLGGFMAVISTVANWFVKKRSLAVGMSMAGMSLGGLLVPILAWLMETYGWRSVAFVSGIIIIVGGIPLAQLLRHAPERYGLLPDGAKPGGA